MVYDYLSQWRDDGVLDDMIRVLREEIRSAAGRNPKSRAGIIDIQTVKTAGPSIDVGYDGGKKIKGRKRHIVVDVFGLLLTVMVHSAGIQDLLKVLHSMQHNATQQQVVYSQIRIQHLLQS